jgi:hypothetical protein
MSVTSNEALPSQRSQTRNRIRATRACQRCSQRKVQCDGTKGGLPCSRCRVDNASDCHFLPSRRGTYPRKKASSAPAPVEALDGLTTLSPPSVNNENTRGLTASPIHIEGSHVNTPASSEPALVTWNSTDATTASAASETNNASLRSNSLAAMFEDFLDGQGSYQDGIMGKRGIIFMGDLSPLTFALEELQRGQIQNPSLHDASSHITTQEPRKDEGLADPQQSTHPAHMAAADITYLEAKGAFDFPKGEVSDDLVAAFLDTFCSLYSIVDRAIFEQLYKQQKVPWILLHAVCFIGTTFCDQNVIYRAGYKSRLHARRLFYEKVKILFDLGYETDKIVLLQTVLLLTFWGPQMKSYWNPCSWIGFGVTIAESLGIYKSTTSANLRAADRSLLRRLWWTLATRDAYCAALLGRPFRINMARCDTQMLSLNDFSSDSSENPAAIYQIQVAKLSIILRQIVVSRSDPTCDSDTIEMLRNMLNHWQTELPAMVDWRRPSTNMADVYATSLKIVFHHHLIVLHLGDPHSISSTINHEMEHDTQSAKIAELAAQTISSSALALMMNSMVAKMPHEVFSGFFMASIVFYRQMKQPNNILRQLGQAALDNCQMVMYETRERWDAAQWALRIFQFLLSRSGADGSQEQGTWEGTDQAGPKLPMPIEINGTAHGDDQFDASNTNDILHSIDFDSPTNQDLMRNFNDIVFLPNYFMAAPDENFSFQF